MSKADLPFIEVACQLETDLDAAYWHPCVLRSDALNEDPRHPATGGIVTLFQHVSLHALLELGLEAILRAEVARDLAAKLGRSQRDRG